MNDDTFNIEHCLTDVILDIPVPISVGKSEFHLYPVTLAKKLMFQRKVEQLGIDAKLLKKNPYFEFARAAHDKKGLCCEILAYYTAPNTKADFHDTRTIDERKKFFEKKVGKEDIVSMLVTLLTTDHTDKLINHLGLDKEREKMNRVMAIKRKHGKNNIAFGGKSFLGTFIGQLKEKGYTDEEILYVHSYTYLMLINADWITSVYMSDEELAEMPTDIGGTMLDGNNPASKEALKDLLRQRGVAVDQ